MIIIFIIKFFVLSISKIFSAVLALPKITTKYAELSNAKRVRMRVCF